MRTLFLNLDDAVMVAYRVFGLDSTIARQEFMQKCYISDDQYQNGFYDGLYKAVDTIKALAETPNLEKEVANEEDSH